MKKLLVILLFAAFMPVVFTSKVIAESPNGKPSMTKTDAVAIANAEAQRQGYNLSQYESPIAEYEFISKDQRWMVFYQGKANDPGNHFSVWVNDRTGKCQLMPGK
jgi:hypothetical protein